MSSLGLDQWTFKIANSASGEVDFSHWEGARLIQW